MTRSTTARRRGSCEAPLADFFGQGDRGQRGPIEAADECERDERQMLDPVQAEHQGRHREHPEGDQEGDVAGAPHGCIARARRALSHGPTGWM
jgi:hypothetical protein